MVKNVRLSPVVARMVAEHQLDITQIVGTGKEGRIRKKDVLLFLESQDKQPDVQPAPVLSPLAEPVQDVVPLTAMRRSIAQHMVQSVQTAPHVTTVFEADMSRVMADRAAQKPLHGWRYHHAAKCPSGHGCGAGARFGGASDPKCR